jgi:N-acyl homoserine lactone hydrolase
MGPQEIRRHPTDGRQAEHFGCHRIGGRSPERRDHEPHPSRSRLRTARHSEGRPIYIGPNEAQASLFLNPFAQGTNDRLLAGRPPLKEFQIPKDPDGKLEGVLDVFGDSSFFVILTPGHTVGHLSFLARTTAGPVLLATDTSHTRWGWDNGVEPGTYLWNRERSHKNLLALKALSERHPNMVVKAGHQP